MTKIITEVVKMPELEKRRFQKNHKNNKWSVVDTLLNEVKYQGNFENVTLVCQNLNNEYYKTLLTKTRSIDPSYVNNNEKR